MGGGGFQMEPDNPLLDDHVVGLARERSGSTANLLALWRLHGLDQVLRDAWDAGTILAGMSAGANCWFDAATTDSFGPTLRPLRGGFGILEGTFIPHLHGEAQRLPWLRRLVVDGTIPAGYGVDDGAALVFRDRELVEVVSSDPSAGACRVEADGHGDVLETALPVRFLGAG